MQPQLADIASCRVPLLRAHVVALLVQLMRVLVRLSLRQHTLKRIRRTQIASQCNSFRVAAPLHVPARKEALKTRPTQSVLLHPLRDTRIQAFSLRLSDWQSVVRRYVRERISTETRSTSAVLCMATSTFLHQHTAARRS